jgi:hypothetical protein
VSESIQGGPITKILHYWWDNLQGEARRVCQSEPLPVQLQASSQVVGTVTANQGTANATPWPTTDAGPSWTSVRQLTTSADMTGAADLTAAPTAGQKIVIDDVIASSDTALYISFVEETSGTEIFRLYLAANGTAQVTTRGKLKLDTADKKLRGDASLAGNVALTVLYHSEA